ncbi:MAG TPA: o-succinylbenzoate synthase [Candidatus Dormibacteraeota bacterium]|nr:o-succinylbenzoate synthase [Candidatus Dormibacteraeota bacterium]
MHIEAVTLRKLAMRLKSPFETSFGSSWDRDVLLVEIQSDGLTGWSEITVSENPFYSPETSVTAWHICRDFLIPSLLGQNVATASQACERFAAIRGHEMARAGIENALWDIEAQQKRLPLWKLLGGVRQEIPSGVSLGIQDTPAKLLKQIETEVNAGYQRIKIKIKPGKDFAYAAAARSEFPTIKLMVDANSAYTLDDTEQLKRFDALYLMMMEQPLWWDDIFAHAELQAQLQTPICLDESIRHLRDAQTAMELKACRIVNIKLGRVGGHTAAREIQKHCLEKGVPAWCGGMLESGIGRAHNVAMSTLPGFTLPGDVAASKRYWVEDLIEPAVEVTPHGTIQVPQGPGIGYAVKRGLVERLTVARETFKSSKP